MSRTIRDIFVEGPISSVMIAESIQRQSTRTEIGAHSIFLGQVRSDEKAAGQVSYIDYTTYKEMALEKAHEIREYIFAKYPITCMRIFHSLGAVKAGELCLFVFTSAKHRNIAIKACEECVEKIKRELPVWGREVINPDVSVWKENT